MIGNIAWMEFGHGIPTSKKIEAFFNTLSELNKCKLRKVITLTKLLRFISRARQEKGIFESYEELERTIIKSGKQLKSFGFSRNQLEDITTDDIINLKIGDSLSNDDRNKLNERLFQTFEECASTLTAYSHILQTIWPLPRHLIAKENKQLVAKKEQENKLCMFFAIKITTQPEKFKGTSKLNKKIQDEIISAATHYLACRDAIVQLNTRLIDSFLEKNLYHYKRTQQNFDDLKQI